MNILEHPIYKAIYDLCLEIEKLPASEQATKVVVMASDLEKPARALLSEIKDLRKQSPMATPGRWCIDWQQPAPSITSNRYTSESEAIEAAKKCVEKYGGYCAVLHAIRAFERIEPVAAQVREVQI